jgi:hypothetical protein
MKIKILQKQIGYLIFIKVSFFSPPYHQYNMYNQYKTYLEIFILIPYEQI